MTLFEPSTSSTFFNLRSLSGLGSDEHRPERFSIPGLKTVEPRFAVPKLDEYAPGQDRMLVGLEDGVWWSQPDIEVGLGQAKGKGKQKAMFEETAELIAEVEARLDWGNLAEAGPSRAKVFKAIPTWDTLDDGQAQNPFASEGGQMVFEAINLITNPPLSFPSLKARPPSAPADPDELLRLLIRATLGTTTTDVLKWDKKRCAYILGDGTLRVGGLSRSLSAGATQDFLDIATALRRLDQILDQQSKSPLTPTHHALFHAVSTYLTFIKNRLSSAISENEAETTSGWVKWKAALKDVGDLLRMLVDLMGWPLAETTQSSLPSRPASLLSHIYSNLLAEHQTSSPGSTGNPTVLCLAYLLQTATAPFLKLLHAWVGLTDSPAEIAATSADDQPWADLGITRLPRRGAMTTELLWDYEFSAKRMPAFVPKDVRRKLFEAGKSLRLLREANGDHPLSSGGWGLEGSWGWGREFSDVHMDVRSHVRRISRETDQWRRSFRDRSRPLSSGSSLSLMRSRPIRKERKRLPTEFFDPSDPFAAQPASSTSRITLSSPDQAADSAEKQLAEFLDMLNQSPGTSSLPPQSTALWSSTPLDNLHSFLKYHSDSSILPAAYPTFPLFIAHHLLAPLLAHANLVSAALVSLYIDDLHFTDHLDILQSFWLGGDAGFFERVSMALFGIGDDQDLGQGTGMGRRARTRARMGLGSTSAGAGGEWGIALGVGLSDRERWPPGGAELAYALRTTLLDDIGGHTGDIRAGKAWEEVEDRVSFAIRPLPEDQDGMRSKWMDPQAIEALDFLYLSYTPPPAMSVVLPRPILEKYQIIHGYLLRLCRVDAVIRIMFNDLHKPQDDSEVSFPKSGVDQPRPKSRSGPTQSWPRRTILSSDPALERTTHQLRFCMSHFVSALLRYVVDSAIGVNFSRMRKRLDKLKRRSSIDSRPQSTTPDDDAYSDFGRDEASLHEQRVEHEDPLDEDMDEEADYEPIQLKAIHSLVAYHHITLDKIMRACLLSPSAGYDVAYKLSMRLLGLILDLGKVVKEVEKRMMDIVEAKERVRGIKKEWEEKETVFMLALERLAQKSNKRDKRAGPTEEAGQGDVEALMDGESSGEGVGDGQSGGGLSELLLRLKMGYGDDGSSGGRRDDAI